MGLPVLVVATFIKQVSLHCVANQCLCSRDKSENDYLQAAVKTHTGKQLTASVAGAGKVSVDAALAALSSESGQFPQRKRTALFFPVFASFRTWFGSSFIGLLKSVICQREIRRKLMSSFTPHENLVVYKWLS